MNTLLHSKTHGNSNEYLVVLHGLFGSGDNWNTLAKKWAEDYTVHLLDLRNHGRSFHSMEMDFSLMAEDLKRYLDENQINKIHLLGHSMGGKMAMKFAFLYPEYVNSLIVADIAPKDYPPHHQDIIKALDSVDFSKVSTRKDVEEQLLAHRLHPMVAQFLMKNVYRKEDDSYAYRFNLEAIKKHYADLVGATDDGSYDGKTLFLAGEKSNYILPEDHAKIKTIFPQAEIKTISKAGHWIHAENPMEFHRVLYEFLKD